MPDEVSLDLGPSRLRPCRHGLMLYLAADTVIGRALELYGEFAESENRCMTQILQPGETVLDVGANIGTVTLPLARRVGPGGRVCAFEPQRIVFQHLCANIALNGLANVDARCAALGAESRTVRIPALEPRLDTNFGSIRLSTDGSGEAVPMIKLDDLNLSHCALIKLDVEGMEWEVLAGGHETIARHRPVVYFEAKTGANTGACLSWLRDRGYVLYWHFSYFFEARNFRGNSDNVFGQSGDINALAIPQERNLPVNLPAISGPDADWKAEYLAWMERRSAKSSFTPRRNDTNS
jgi:FkbM family methyltransferase